MRILITGVSGHVGGALLPRLHGHDLIAADRATLDLAKPEVLGATLERLKPELIINPAAYTAVDEAEDAPDLAYLVNATAPATMARWAADRSVPFLHFSTDYVFDGRGDRPWREDDAARPLSVYGASKLAGEDAIRAAGGLFMIARCSWIYAATGKNFLRTIARLASEQSELRIVADQVGAPTPAGMIAETVAQMIAEGLDAFRSRCTRSGGLIHLCAAGETSWYGFANSIVEGLKQRGVALRVQQIHPVDSEDYPTRAKRPRNSRLDLSRLRDVCAITPRPWLDAVAPELDILADAMR
jgi:dTDP-4-dehydrorhamnose reductase